jgi:hypothetical protein
VSFPDVSEPMVLHAEVRRRDGEHYGFEFAALSDRTRDLLRKCLSDLPVD